MTSVTNNILLPTCMRLYNTEVTDMRAAWEYGEVTSMIHGNGFDSQIFIFIVIVGSEEKAFTAHESFLSQSPVFEKMCHGQFQESHAFEIKLPEDDPKVMRAIIQYLYTGNFLDFGSMESGHGPKGAGSQLAALYVTAEKYQLQNLKNLVLAKLGSMIDLEVHPLDFLCIAELIYASIPDTDNLWRGFFKQYAGLMPKPRFMSKSVRCAFDVYIHEGGTQAVDMMDAICSDYDNQIQIWEDKEVKVKDKKVKVRDNETDPTT
ncbi:MAG: hypothetical protein Q9166_005910 [cf. Caloplaca sp. 2 TL-2023]